ncbi:hypothetical protein SOVF_072480 [Spinacia oleracea]|nr:hypothetical protein SOVF_072480 [Spinacia oleracea]
MDQGHSEKRFKNHPQHKLATINQPDINVPRHQSRPSPTVTIPDAPIHISLLSPSRSRA